MKVPDEKLHQNPWVTQMIALCVAITIALFAGAASAQEAGSMDYRLGQGYRVGDSGLTLGGYATLSAESLRGEQSRVAVDDLSLFVWWESEQRWKLFAELDYEDVLAHPSRDRDGERRYLALERLYADYAIDDTLSVRVGKFLTPIGRWNLIHATPLVWTSSRPLITDQTFPTNVTGLMLSGSINALDDGIDYAIYASRGHEIRANPAIDPFNEVLGAHVSLPVTRDARLGISAARFEQESDRDTYKTLFGLDFLWAAHDWELSAEAVYRHADTKGEQTEKGAFVQLVAPLAPRLYGVGRIEAFRKAQTDETTRVFVGGINYRIDPAVVLKAEWIGTGNNRIDAPHGLMTSISVMF